MLPSLSLLMLLLVGGLGVDLAAVSGTQLDLTGGCEGSWWQHGIVC
jgi:hypothetical protein